MNIFEVSDREGCTLSVDVAGEFASTGGRFMATVSDHKVKRVVSVIFGDDAARALIKALRGALPPEQTEVAAPAPTYRPKRADYIRQAAQLLHDQECPVSADGLLQIAHFLANGDR